MRLLGSISTFAEAGSGADPPARRRDPEAVRGALIGAVAAARRLSDYSPSRMRLRNMLENAKQHAAWGTLAAPTRGDHNDQKSLFFLHRPYSNSDAAETSLSAVRWLSDHHTNA